MTDTNKTITGLVPSTVIEKTWEPLPGMILCFPLSIAMSGAAANAREAAIGMSAHEKAERLLDFRIRMIAEVLNAPPYLIQFDRIGKALEAKQAPVIKAVTIDKGLPEYAKKVERIRQRVLLTPEEVEALHEPFPDFPETTLEDLTEKAYEYFNQNDERGRKVFQLLIEEVVSEFWLWATPRPTLTVSVFTQGK